MRNSKLLMLNAVIHDVPLILEAQKQGFYVITTGNKPGYPGHAFSDEYINCDFSDYEALVKLCIDNDISAVSCGTSDAASYPASYLSDYFGWKGHDSLKTIKTLHNKVDFKQFTKENGIQSPVSEVFSDLEEAKEYVKNVKYPIIVKPSDCAGGQGISVANNKDEALCSVKVALARSYEGRIVIEPYLKGTQHTFMAYLLNQKVVNYCTWDDITYPGRYMISKGTCPASYENAEYVDSVIIRNIEIIAKTLQLVDGMFSIQCIVENGEPYIIEVMRRCPGNWDTCMATSVSGINWDQWVILAEAGKDVHGIPKNRKMEGFWGYYIILSSTNGIFDSVDISEAVRNNIYRYNLWEKPGFQINDFEHDKLGIVHLWFNSREEMMNKMKRIDDLIRVKTK